MIKSICLLVPVIILILYIINLLKPFGFIEKLSNSNRNKLFYGIFLLWFSIFCFVFNKEIVNLKVLSNLNYGTNPSLFNYTIISILFLITMIIINLIFIKNFSISKFNIKGVEINVSEINDIAKASITRKEDYLLLCNIFLIQYDIISNIYDYIDKLPSIEKSNIYSGFIKYYADARKKIKIQCYYYTLEGLLDLKYNNKISDEEFSTVEHSLEINGVCIPFQEEVKIIYAKIITSFVFPDLVIRIEGEKLFEQEHMFIQNMISVFDKELTINALETEY